MSSAIRDVGRTLVNLLRDNLADDNAPGGIRRQQIVLLPPAEAKTGGVRLTLFLYAIAPAAELRNEMEIPGGPEGDEAVSEPLDLYFLLTAFAPAEGDDPTERTHDSHLLLGTAMRVFFDNGTLTGSVLQGDLPRDEELRLTLQPMTVEDLTRIWSVFPESVLHASVSYLVTPVRLRSTRTRGGTRVVSRAADVGHVVPTGVEAGLP
jgi:Pvc16 N-terminal domain